MLKTIIYTRYSSDKQNEQSIEGQIQECEQFAKTHDMVIIKHYIDHALSGKTDDRPSFLQRYQKFYTKENNFETFTI